MSKDWQVRLNKTIEFIRSANSTSVPTAERGGVMTELQRWNSQELATVRQTVSQLMSQEKVTKRPSDPGRRHYRRATILLHCAINHPASEWTQQAGDVNAIPAGQESALFEVALEDASDKVGTELAGGLIAELKSNPLKFLQSHRLTLGGKAMAAVFPYGVYIRKGKLRIDPYDSDASHQKVRAINVPATLWPTVEKSLGAIVGTRSSDYDCDLMLTTQFTGCTYCFMINGSSLVAAHIDPGGGVGRDPNAPSGETISKQLRTSGGFANGNGGAFKAFGRTSDAEFGYPKTADQMTIVAVKDNADTWKVYSQVLTGSTISARCIS